MRWEDIQNLAILLILVVASLTIFLFFRFSYRYFRKHHLIDSISKDIKSREFKRALNNALKYLQLEVADFMMYFFIAQAYEGLSQNRQAVDYYEKTLVKLENENKPAIKLNVLNKLGELYYQLKDITSALSCFNSVLKESPRNPDALYQSALIYNDSKNYTQAKRNLEAFLAVKPNTMKAQLLLAKIYFLLAQYLNSIHQLEHISSPDGTVSAVFAFESGMLLSKNYIAMKNYSKAVEVLKPFLNNRQYLDKVIEKIVFALIKDKKLENALEIADTYFNRVAVSQRCELLYQLAKAYFDEGEIYKAIDFWRKISQLNPDYSDIRLLLQDYQVLIENPGLQGIFTSSNFEFEQHILKKLKLNAASTIELDKSFGLFKNEDDYLVVYRIPGELNIQEITVMLNRIMSYTSHVNLINLYCLVSLSETCKQYCNDKKIIEISGSAFQSLFK